MADGEAKTAAVQDEPGVTAEATVPTVKWDDANMRTSYANVVNAASSREEMTLFFGTNQTWNVTDKKEFNVLLSNRIVLNPFAAKRLWMLLGSILKEYESRYGTLEIDVSRSGQKP